MQSTISPRSLSASSSPMTSCCTTSYAFAPATASPSPSATTTYPPKSSPQSTSNAWNSRFTPSSIPRESNASIRGHPTRQSCPPQNSKNSLRQTTSPCFAPRTAPLPDARENSCRLDTRSPAITAISIPIIRAFRSSPSLIAQGNQSDLPNRLPWDLPKLV